MTVPDFPNLSRRALIHGAMGGVVALQAAATLPSAYAQQGGANLPPEDPNGLVASLTDGIFIGSNEHPLGPSPAALRALSGLDPLYGRYGMAFADKVAALFAKQNGLLPEQVQIHPGSYMPLRSAALTYSSKARPIAYGEPTFDAGFIGRNGECVTRAGTVPLQGDYKLDVRKLLAAAPDAGVYYICNPNNPTGLVTPRSDIEWLLANKPKGSILLIDEAYIDFSDAVSCLDLVAKGADLLVTRTFSKIYGLAGLRCGLIAGRKDLLDGMADYGVNITSMPALVAAQASLLETGLLPGRKAVNKAVRDDLFKWLGARGVRYLPSEGCFAMVHVGRPGEQVVAALAKEKIFISGPRKHMPDWVRVSIGTQAEMNAFKTAFTKIIS